MSAHETCSCCRARVNPVRPSFAARAAFFGLLLGFVGLVAAYPLFGFLWTFTIPVLMVAGMGIGPLVDAAFAPALCPSCGRRFEPAPETRVEPVPAAARVDLAS